MTSEYSATIGLEVHAQLLTKSKLFCACSAEFGAEPNARACPVCLGLPGALPVLNRKVLEYALLTATALNCRINLTNRFSRKNYFYPDLPKGYQISQFRLPLAENGFLETPLPEGNFKKIRIKRLHLEEDAGKSIHLRYEGRGTGSVIDYNRSGVPLMEIVSEPDIGTPEEAYRYLDELRSVLLFLGVCACNMEEGNLRCDANISVAPKNSDKLGTKTELKNLNSLKFMKSALQYEIERQTKILEGGGKIIHETLLWDEDSSKTRSMRTKEEAHDYRYFPEPDLPPVRIDDAELADIRRKLPELPNAKRARWESEYGIPPYDAYVLTQEPSVADFFDETVKLVGAEEAKTASNWIMGEALRLVKNTKVSLAESALKPSHLAEIIKLVSAGAVSGKAAKEIFPEIFKKGVSPETLVKEKELSQISDESALATLVEEVIRENKSAVSEYLSGKEKSFGFLMGAVMKKSKGRANPQTAERILREKLEKAK